MLKQVKNSLIQIKLFQLLFILLFISHIQIGSGSLINPSNKILEIEYYLSFDTFFIKMDLGNKEKYLQIDLHSKYNFISKNLKFILSESVQKDIGRDFDIDGRTVMIWQYFDRLSYKGIRYPNFYFYFYEDYLKKADTLSLSYDVEKEEQSLLTGLRKTGQIDNEIFGFSKVNEEDNSGTLFLGGIPKEYFNQYDYKKCPVIYGDKSYQSWGCNISSVTIGETFYDSQGDFGYFQTSRRFIFAPKKFMLLLNTMIFDEYTKKNLCFRMKDKEYFFCKEEVVKSFPNITLSFGDVKIVLTKDELFESYSDVYLFMIYEIYKKKETTSDGLWMLGYRFFKQHPIFFDKENDEVTIFYNEGRKFNLYLNIKSKCMLINIFLCSFALILLFITQIYDPIILKETDE